MQKKIIFLSGLLIGITALLFFFFPKSAKEYCAFCDPKVIEKQLITEEKEALAIVTHKPIVPGHFLVLPKRHVERFEELSDSEIVAMTHLIQKVNLAVSKVYGTSGYLLVQKNGKEAWQSVPHVHFHYIPRKKNDSSSLIFLLKSFIASVKSPLSSEEMLEEREKIQREL